VNISDVPSERQLAIGSSFSGPLIIPGVYQYYSLTIPNSLEFVGVEV